MELVSRRISELSPSMTLAITSQAKRLKDDGVDVCSFGAGEPDFDTPAHIKEAAIAALEAGKTGYTASEGILPLREALSAKFLTDNGIEYRPDQIQVSCGAKHSCYNAILACCDEGDEVIIPAPYWTSYPEMVKMAGAEPFIVETSKDNGWKLTPEQFEKSISGKTKMVILNSPGNPTGTVYTRDELKGLAEVAIEEGVVILSDEIYEKLVYDGHEHVSVASLGREIYEHTITVNGFSKAYAMTGWRLGYTGAPPALAQAMANIQSHMTSNPTTFAQYGGLAALEGDQDVLDEMLGEFAVRRQYMAGRLREIPNVGVIEPHGAFYFLVDISPMQLSSLNLAEKLLSRYHVAVVPGEAFGAPGTIRFSYATGLDVIAEGLQRFEQFCQDH